MPRSKHSEAATIAALQQLDAGRKVADLAREAGVSAYTIYVSKAKYGGMDVSQGYGAGSPGFVRSCKAIITRTGTVAPVGRFEQLLNNNFFAVSGKSTKINR